MTAYRVGPFELLAERRTLAIDGRQVALGPKVVETLLALVEHAGRPLEKNALLDRIWPEGFVEESNLAQNVYVLRRTFRAYGIADAIETVPGVGYCLNVPVRAVSRAAPSRQWPLVRIAIAGAVVLAIAGFITLAGAQSRARRDGAATLSPAGERAYVVGRYYWNLRTARAVERSLGYFDRVVDSDPQSPLGYAALADANVTMGDYCYGLHRPALYFARARSYAEKALELDSNSAQAHAALGFLELHYDDKAVAESELRRAIALDPAYPPAHEWYGIALMLRGRPADAEDELSIASNLDPLSASTAAWLGRSALGRGRFGDAIAHAREALDLTPQRIDALATIAVAYRMSGDAKAAADALARYRALADTRKMQPHHPVWAAVENAAHTSPVQ